MTRDDVVPVEGVDVQTGLLLATLDANTREWQNYLGDVTEEMIVWQPFPNGHSIGALLLHIAEVEVFWIQEVGAGRPMTPEQIAEYLSEEIHQGAVQWPIPPKQPLAWYRDKLKAVRARTHEIVRALNHPEHLSPHTDRHGTGEFTLRWLLQHVLTHEAYHGGQAVLLALMQTAAAGQPRPDA